MLKENEYAHTLESLEFHAAKEMLAVLDRSQAIKHFHEGYIPSREHFIRHLVEDVLRMRENDEVDLLCLSHLGFRNRIVSLGLLKYLHEEASHSQMILRDLQALGVTEEEALTTQPMFSTCLLMGYLRRSIQTEGPLANFVWSWFVEWYSARFNGKILQGAGELLGKEALKGNFAHLAIDDDKDHPAFTTQLLLQLLIAPANWNAAHAHVTRFSRLIEMYYLELLEDNYSR